MAEHRHHRHNPSEGGWDPTIVRAPDSHKASSKRHHRRHHSRRRRRKVLKVVGIVVAVLVAVLLVTGVALALYVRSLDEKMAIDDPEGELAEALTDAPLDQSFYVLVMGLDLREYTQASNTGMSQEELDELNARIAAESTQYSDVMILLRVDPVSSKVTMLSVPRDTPYTAPDGSTQKINHAFATGGAPAAVRAVEDLTGVAVAHYVEVTGSGLEELVDSLGGISVDVPVEIHGTTSTTHERVDLEPGLQHVNGAEAMALANFRGVYGTQQDYNRQVGVRQVAAGIVNSVRSQPVTELPGVVSRAASCVKTDMTVGELVELARNMGQNVAVYSGTGPYDGGLDYWVGYPESLTEGAWWFCYVNEAGWEHVLAVMAAGDDPSAVTYDSDVVHYAEQPQATWSQGLVEPEGLEE